MQSLLTETEKRTSKVCLVWVKLKYEIPISPTGEPGFWIISLNKCGYTGVIVHLKGKKMK
jgi:hypothetical protein